MRNKEFYDLDHAQAYLSNSVIRYKGEPVFINSIMTNEDDEDLEAEYYSVWDRDRSEVAPLDSDDWDMTPVPLGFMNYEAFGTICTAISLSRMPHRAWKIGLNSSNMYIRPVINFGGLPGPHNLIMTKFFRDTVIGEYPSFNSVLNKVNIPNSYRAHAFSREFAITNSMELHHCLLKGPVGQINAYNGDVDLADDYKYLSETLMRDMAA